VSIISAYNQAINPWKNNFEIPLRLLASKKRLFYFLSDRKKEKKNIIVTGAFKYQNKNTLYRSEPK